MNSLFKTVTGAHPAAKSNEQDNISALSYADLNASQKIFVRDYTLEMLIGILPEETENKQRVVLSIEVETAVNPNWKADKITETVSYVDLIDMAEAIAAEGHINLVETYAELILCKCMDVDAVHSAEVTVAKPDIIANAGSVGVTISRSK